METPSSRLSTDEIISAVAQLSLPEIEEVFDHVLALQAERQAGHLSHFQDDRSVHETERRFRRLVNQWRKETEHISSIAKASMHPAYQRIIGMGYDAIPYLLRELQQDPDHWFWALNAITEQDPAQSEDTFDGAVGAWLRWGKENGHL